MENTLETNRQRSQAPSALLAWLVLAVVFLAVQVGSLFTPPLLDDVDAAHAQAAQHMAETGDLVTLKIDGIRYLEKPPLPYWMVAALYRVFGAEYVCHAAAQLAGDAGVRWLAWMWAGRAWGQRAGFYAAWAYSHRSGRFCLRASHSRGGADISFLFALYGFITGLESRRPVRFYGMWAALALAT